jgi:hypothetical protein
VLALTLTLVPTKPVEFFWAKPLARPRIWLDVWLTNTPGAMLEDKRHSDYHLGNTDAEHERLIRQAIRLAPVTERFFREVGIGCGQQVLDLGAGVGDVAMLVSRIVANSKTQSFARVAWRS